MVTVKAFQKRQSKDGKEFIGLPITDAKYRNGLGDN